MAESAEHGVSGEQVLKALKALFAHRKTKDSGNSLLLNEHDRISLMLTVWKIPKEAQTIKIPLPHGIRPDTYEVCLFTKDEPNMSIEQTEKFYKNLLSQHGVKQITEIIPLKKMKKEYKPFEAKRRLLGLFDLFLADDRIRRLLPSHIGKHFYKAKREPISVSLKGKNFAAVLNRIIQGTQLHIINKGCCFSIRVGHTGMKVEDIAENVLAVAQVLAEKLPKKWKNVKVLHLKTQSSVALPIYTSSFDSLKELNLIAKKKTTKKKSAKKSKPVKPDSEETGDQLADEKKDTATPHTKQKQPDNAEEERIPMLVPIQEPSSAKKKKKKRDVLEESKVEEKGKSSVQKEGSPTKKSKLQKRKMKENEDVIKTLSEHQKELPSDEKNEEPEEREIPPKHSILKKTPKKTSSNTAVKLTKSARKAPQTPKQKQKKKMKTPQSVGLFDI